MLDGLLLINKPEGISSFDCIRRLRRTILSDLTNHTKPKIGHAGTLDPAASGLMLMLFGSACKQAATYSKLDKTYEAKITLGATSSTGDREGNIVQRLESRAPNPGLKEVQRVVDGFVGEITQVPSVYSAIKISGQEAYKRARRGETVEMPSRQVTINGLKVVDYQFPILTLEADVSSGTYIRTLAADIGEKLGVGAYLSSLVRTRVGQFSLGQAIELDAPSELLSSSLIL